MQQLLRLAPHKALPKSAMFLAAAYAEDVLRTEDIEAMVNEAKEADDKFEVLWLYFRCRERGLQVVQTILSAKKWVFANSSMDDLGAHGTMICVGIHVRGQHAKA